MKTSAALNGAARISKLYSLPMNWNVNTPRRHSKKPFTCKYCNTANLVWTFEFGSRGSLPFDPVNKRFHRCLADKAWRERVNQEEISPGACRYCGSQELLWVRTREWKYELIETWGLPHTCNESVVLYEAHKEALREDYARTKTWISSFNDGVQCRRCKATGQLVLKDKRNRFGVKVKKCPNCKGIGEFTPERKKYFLQQLRKQYWPYKPWMKWNFK